MTPPNIYPEGIPFPDARPPQDNPDRLQDDTSLQAVTGGEQIVRGARGYQVYPDDTGNQLPGLLYPNGQNQQPGSLSPLDIVQDPPTYGPNVLQDDITIRTGPIYAPSVILPIPPLEGAVITQTLRGLTQSATVVDTPQGLLPTSINQTLGKLSQSASATDTHATRSASVSQTLGALTQSGIFLDTSGAGTETASIKQTLMALTQHATATDTHAPRTSTISQTLGKLTQRGNLTDGPVPNPNYPALLNSYVARAPWQVAGVDFYVGPQPSGAYKIPGVDIPPANVSVNSTTHVWTITGAGVVIDGWDFSGNGGWQINITSSVANGFVIKNCNFKTGTNNYIFVSISGTCGGGTITNNQMDGANIYVGLDANAPIEPGAVTGSAGTFTIQYNWFLNCAINIIESGQHGGSTINFNYNLSENVGASAGHGPHSNLLFFFGNYAYIDVSYNTFIQNISGYGARGLVFGDNFFQPTCTTPPNFSNNTFALSATPGAASMTALLAMNQSQIATATTAHEDNNYFDCTDTPGSSTSNVYSNSTGLKPTCTGFIDDGSGGGSYSGVPGTVFTVTAATGTPYAGVHNWYLFGTSVMTNTQVPAILTGSGGAGTYSVTISQATPSTTMTLSDGPYGLAPGTITKVGNTDMKTGLNIP